MWHILLIGILIIVVIYIIMMYTGVIGPKRYKFVGNYRDTGTRAMTFIAQGTFAQMIGHVKKDQPKVFGLQDGHSDGQFVQLFYDNSPGKIGYKKYGPSDARTNKFAFEGMTYQLGAGWVNSVYVS